MKTIEDMLLMIVYYLRNFLGPQAYLVFGGEHAIHNLTISGIHYGDVVLNRNAPIAIGHDVNNGYVYWSDILDGTIERARLLGDGTAETVVKKVVHSNGTFNRSKSMLLATCMFLYYKFVRLLSI